MKKKQIILATSLATLGTVGLVGVSHIVGATSQSKDSKLVESIASKFDLKQEDVQKVVDEYRASQKAEKEAETTAKIDQLVTDGKLTKAQADAIKAKRTELKADREAKKNSSESSSKTDEQKKADREAKKTALDKWFTDNNISEEYRYLVMGRGGRGGDRAKGGQKSEQKTDQSTKSDQSDSSKTNQQKSDQKTTNKESNTSK